MNRVTIKDVALAAGVSTSAVSRVFTDGASASSKTREKVHRAAEELGYRPSMLARGLTGIRTNMVTLVTGPMQDPFDCLFLDALSQSLAHRGTRLLLVSAVGAQGENALLDALDYRSDAVIVAAGTLSPEHSAQCVKAGLPVILSGRVVETPGVDCVLADNAAGGRQAADLLWRTGCRKLAYLGQGGATFSDRERFDGFSQAARRHGLDVQSVAVHRLGRPVSPLAHASGAPANVIHETARDATMALLTGEDPPDGLFCSNDSLALDAIETARSLGLKSPWDLSIIGFNNIPQADRASYRLTTLDYPVDHLVSEIIEALYSRLDTPRRADCIRRIVPRLIIRSTTRQVGPEGDFS